MADLSTPARFAGDDGATAPAVAEVLARHSGGAATAREVVNALVGQRLLVPLLEVDGDQLDGDDADPCAGADRAVAAVSLRRADGTAVSLAFTGMPCLLAWNAQARPMPETAERVAAALLAEGGSTLLLDPGTPTATRISGAALARLAGGEAWPDPWVDPLVRTAVVGELAPILGEVQVRLAAPAPGEGADLVVELRFSADLDDDVVGRRTAVVAQRLADSAAMRAVFDGVLAVRRA